MHICRWMSALFMIDSRKIMKELGVVLRENKETIMGMLTAIGEKDHTSIKDSQSL